MSAKPHGVPAFPRPVSEYADLEGRRTSQKGMTLRQWYAGQALGGSLFDQGENYEVAASSAFQYADAMIAHEKGEA